MLLGVIVKELEGLLVELILPVDIETFLSERDGAEGFDEGWFVITVDEPAEPVDLITLFGFNSPVTGTWAACEVGVWSLLSTWLVIWPICSKTLARSRCSIDSSSSGSGAPDSLAACSDLLYESAVLRCGVSGPRCSSGLICVLSRPVHRIPESTNDASELLDGAVDVFVNLFDFTLPTLVSPKLSDLLALGSVLIGVRHSTSSCSVLVSFDASESAQLNLVASTFEWAGASNLGFGGSGFDVRDAWFSLLTMLTSEQSWIILSLMLFWRFFERSVGYSVLVEYDGSASACLTRDIGSEKVVVRWWVLASLLSCLGAVSERGRGLMAVSSLDGWGFISSFSLSNLLAGPLFSTRDTLASDRDVETGAELEERSFGIDFGCSFTRFWITTAAMPSARERLTGVALGARSFGFDLGCSFIWVWVGTAFELADRTDEDGIRASTTAPTLFLPVVAGLAAPLVL